jgi:hypothetical protein
LFRLPGEGEGPRVETPLWRPKVVTCPPVAGAEYDGVQHLFKRGEIAGWTVPMPRWVRLMLLAAVLCTITIGSTITTSAAGGGTVTLSGKFSGPLTIRCPNAGACSLGTGLANKYIGGQFHSRDSAYAYVCAPPTGGFVGHLFFLDVVGVLAGRTWTVDMQMGMAERSVFLHRR